MRRHRGYWVATSELHTVTLEKDASPGEALKDVDATLTVDHFPPATLKLPPWYFPGFAFSSERLLIWCGCSIYNFHLASGQLTARDDEDEVVFAYSVDGLWCLVCETSIALFDSRCEHEISRFQHSEVFLRSWWKDGLLVAEDFAGKRFQARVSTSDLEVIELG